MMATIISHNTLGIKVQGQGGGATRIDYNPSVTGTPFLTNQWLIGNVMQDISFISHDPTADFLASVEGTAGGGNIGDYHFYRCSWGGAWNNIFNLTGTNNNSEWKISQCTIGGTLAGSWLNVGPSVGSGGDQFLNFWFDDCKFNCSTGSWITLNRGGSVRLTACDSSGWVPSTPTYLFNLLGFTHAQGVCSFSCDKLRMEMNSPNCLLIHSQWPFGNVSFDAVDSSSNVAAYPSTNAPIFIEIQNQPGASYNFFNSNFVGQANISYDSGAWTHQSNISFKSCNILQWPNAATYVTFTELTTNKGGAPPVDFDINCKGNDVSEMFPTTLNWQFSTSGVTQPKTVQFCGSNTQGPTSLGNITRKLPVNAVLRSVNFNSAGSGTGGAYGFQFQTSEASPTLLGAAFSGSNATVAANPAASAVNFWMLNDLQRTIQLVETVGRSAAFTNYIATVTYDG